MRGQDMVSVLKGVGEQREKRLHRLGIVTVEDLLTHYPREYKDRSEILKIADLPPDEPATFLAQIKEEGQNSRHGRLVYTRMKVYDETGAVGVLWYNQPYMKSSLKIGEWYLFSGKLQKKYGRTEVVSPECERIGENFAGGRILPVYPSVEGLSQKMLRNLMEEALKEMSGGMQEELPLWLRKEYHLAERNFAIENIHFPKTEQGFHDARKRLVFEELFLLQTALYQLKSTLEERGEGIRLKKKKALQDGETLLPFALTDAQKRVLAEIVQDMTSGKIMNRLVQGDVGSGKTAVALLAAYWTIQNGYQAAMMAPTEVLARQHAASFRDLLEPAGITVVLLTGSLTAKEKRERLAQVADGTAQMVIGTHAVIQKGVEFQKLGLAITDEQHRFGVRQRSTLAEKGENVHTLVMTATPIPRTLHMSLVGIRDMSVLEEPPIDRMPIQTYVMEENDEMVREAIEREISRQGQVYYVYNRVQDIAEMAAKIQKLVPDANVAYAHGQMREHKLEDIMYDFINGEIDVLVSTTIIETGLDISNANTMIIHDADRMGLSQLYQLRGRVGRSNRMAYAFLLYRRDKMLREVAEKRLSAIREFTDLGSGVKIAMRDLEIRGAGNLLGEEQHGHMDAVGYDLYCKMLSEAVRHLKGEIPEETYATTVDLNIDAYIPASYIPNEYQKLDIYKRISAIETEDEYMDMQDELLDRFGDIPKSVENLLVIARVRALAHKCYVTEVLVKEKEVKLTMYQKAKINVGGIPDLVNSYGGALKLVPGEVPVFHYVERKPKGITIEDMLFKAEEILKGLRKLRM